MRFERKRARAGLVATAVLPLVAGALVLGAQSATADQPQGRQLLNGTKPQWATAKADKGSTADASKVTVRVYLAGKDAKGLAAYAQAVSDPTSASYGHYLTPAQTDQRFGATKAQISGVTSWLTSNGLKVTGTNKRYLTATGDVSAAEKAFGTQLHNYTKAGHTYRAPTGTASAPTSLQGAVLTVTGLDNAPKRASHDDTLPPPEPAFVNSGPFSSYYGSNTDKKLPSAYGSKAPYTIKGYTGEQLRAAYGAGKYTGKGVTVAITDAYASPNIASDSAKLAKDTGGQKYRKGQLSQVVPTDDGYNSVEDCDASGWYGEESLDVESVHAVAPDADIVYVGAASCNDDDLLGSLATVVDGRLATIVTNSWGDVEANETSDVAAAYDQVFEQGAVEGIGFYFSSGDDGDDVIDEGVTDINTPANSPWVTSVGGTSLAVGKNDKYLWETGWGTERAPLSADGKTWTGFPGPFTSGAGGGTSRAYAQPFYQKGVVPDSLALANGGTTKMRVEPDIAAVADPNTGFLVGETMTFPDGTVKYNEYRLGGTSLASPVTAGVQALAEQARGGVPIGFANPGIYDKYGTAAYHDVTDHPLGQGQGIANVRVDFANATDASDGLITSLRTFGVDSTLHATVGYDNVTGVGSPGKDYVSSYKPKKSH
ncbi:Pro-kumamolisin, activation domain [Streptomyces sp. DvalAA-14]|uniref:S53 family peptidase n=1 Tax=unclassified Streptomyces TaxID=2593676 RepID=UPI00081BAEB6|nr:MULTISPECIES: S53 family peptidase [unclassified Streptomyces]MYS25055.1 serine protease [Streptomyces sp. SID4948]SCE51688.1 Pro-kumamolisin, activation domain [Streptomyces sp. DvalAA-14]